MASRIKLLDEDTIGKIAAGEVIERPASVVKELIENSIDANAKRIDIEIKEGGRSLIRVTDDGFGMTNEEAELSLKRHSTSKINSADDLFSISTLGFRGEALPTISSVSKFEISTKTDNSNNNGFNIRVEGGQTKEKKETGCPSGTTITVKDLFFNTPARQKYMRKESTEQSHIADIVSRYIIAYPAIAFKLTSNGKKIILSKGNGDLLDALTNVYGKEIASNVIKIENSSGYVDVSGYVVRPTMTRIDRNHQSFFVNGRSVRNALLSRALEDSYRSLIPKDRHPVAALFININPKEVDVNVHPTKREVRFAKTSPVLQSINKAVTEVLGLKLGRDLKVGNQTGTTWTSEMAEVFFGQDSAVSMPQTDISSLEIDKNSGPVPICQINNTYIIAVNQSGFMLIDQHALHERVVYEELKSRNSDTSMQKLLVPENLELSQSDSPILKENLSYLKEVGFEIEEFGKDAFIIRSVPVQVVGSSAVKMVEDIVAEIKNYGASKALNEKQDAVLKLIACHGSVRAGESLSFEQMKGLLNKINKTSNSSTCPHGRPTIIQFSLNDLEKMFKRA